MRIRTITFAAVALVGLLPVLFLSACEDGEPSDLRDYITQMQPWFEEDPAVFGRILGTGDSLLERLRMIEPPFEMISEHELLITAYRSYLVASEGPDTAALRAYVLAEAVWADSLAAECDLVVGVLPISTIEDCLER